MTPIFCLQYLQMARIQEDLHILQDLSADMQLQYNRLKCKVMHLGIMNLVVDYSMKSQDGTIHTLESIKEERDLGVLIDNQLSFKSHLLSKVKKKQMIRIIRNSFINLDRTIFPQLFKSLVRPHVEYAYCIWPPSVKYLSKTVESVQRRASKLPIAMTSLSYEERLHGLPSLK